VFKLRRKLLFFPSLANRSTVHMVRSCVTSGDSPCRLVSEVGKKPSWQCNAQRGSSCPLSKYFHRLGLEAISERCVVDAMNATISFSSMMAWRNRTTYCRANHHDVFLRSLPSTFFPCFASTPFTPRNVDSLQNRPYPRSRTTRRSCIYSCQCHPAPKSPAQADLSRAASMSSIKRRGGVAWRLKPGRGH